MALVLAGFAVVAMALVVAVIVLAVAWRRAVRRLDQLEAVTAVRPPAKPKGRRHLWPIPAAAALGAARQHKPAVGGLATAVLAAIIALALVDGSDEPAPTPTTRTPTTMESFEPPPTTQPAAPEQAVSGASPPPAEVTITVETAPAAPTTTAPPPTTTVPPTTIAVQPPPTTGPPTTTTPPTTEPPDDTPNPPTDPPGQTDDAGIEVELSASATPDGLNVGLTVDIGLIAVEKAVSVQPGLVLGDLPSNPLVGPQPVHFRPVRGERPRDGGQLGRRRCGCG